MAKKLYIQPNSYLPTQKKTKFSTNESSQVDVALDNKKGLAASAVMPHYSYAVKVSTNTTPQVTDDKRNYHTGQTDILDTKGFQGIKMPKGSQPTELSHRASGNSTNKSNTGPHATDKPIQATSTGDRTHADSKGSQATDSHSVDDGTPILNIKSAITVEPQNTDKLPPVKDGTPLSSTVEPQNTDKLPPVTEATPLSSTVEPHNTDKPSPATDGTQLSSIVEPHNTDKPSPATDGTQLFSTVEPQNTDKPSPVTDGTPLSSTVEPHNTDKPSPATDGTQLSNTVELQSIEKSHSVTDGTPLPSSVEPQNNDKPSPVTDGTPLSSTVEPQNTDKLPPVKDGTPLSSSVEPQNTDKPSPPTDGTSLSSRVEPQNTDKSSPATDGTPLSSTVEPHKTDTPSPATDGTPLSSTVEPQNTDTPSPATDGTPLSSIVEPHKTDTPSPATDGTPLSSTVEPHNTDKPSPATDGTSLSSTVEQQNTDTLHPASDGTSLSSTVEQQNTDTLHPASDGTPLSSTVKPQKTDTSFPGTDGTPLSSTVEPQNTDKLHPASDGIPLSCTVEPQNTDKLHPVKDCTPLSSTVERENTDKLPPVKDSTPLSCTVEPQNTEKSPIVTDSLRNPSTKGSQTTGEIPHPTNGDIPNLSPEGAQVTDKSPIPNTSLLATDKQTCSTEETHMADKLIVAHNKAKRVSAKKTQGGHCLKVVNSKEAASILMKMVCDPESLSTGLDWSILIVDYDNWTKVFKIFNSDYVDNIIVVLIYRQDMPHEFKEPKEVAYKRMKEKGHVLLFEAGVNKDATDCRMLLTIKDLLDCELPKNVLVKALSGDKIFLEMMVDMKEYVATGQLDFVYTHDSVLANYNHITKLEPRDDALKLAFINIPTSADKNEPVVWGKNMVLKRDDSLLKYITGRINVDMKLPQPMQPESAYRIPQKNRTCPDSTNKPPGIVIVVFASEKDSTQVLRNRSMLQGSKYHMNVLVRPTQSWNKRLTTRHLPTENNDVYNALGVNGVENYADNQNDISSGTVGEQSNTSDPNVANSGLDVNAVEAHADRNKNKTVLNNSGRGNKAYTQGNQEHYRRGRGRRYNGGRGSCR